MNNLITIYYLAIEKTLFPSFAFYIIITTSIGIPLLILIGYIHYKRSKVFHAENNTS